MNTHLKIIVIAIVALVIGLAGGKFMLTTNSNPNTSVVQTSTSDNPNLAHRVTSNEEHYIFELADSVTREHVYYFNRFGIEIAADLYIDKDTDLSQSHPAIIVGPPFGGVKEQGPGVYANQLAQRGFIVLAIDPAYHGYSGGSPRYNASTTLYAEDFSAAVDFLGSQEFVDKNKIGVIGICGSGGFALSAAAMDTRIKAVATSVMYDIAANMNQISGAAREQMLSSAGEARYRAFQTGQYDFMKSYPDEPVDEIPADLDPVSAEFFSFYGMKRGWHPNALGNITMVSPGDLMTFPSNTHLSELNIPLLFVVGENAHSLGYSQTAYDAATTATNKELYLVPNANHVDLYDDVSKIPFDKLTEFFTANL